MTTLCPITGRDLLLCSGEGPMHTAMHITELTEPLVPQELLDNFGEEVTAMRRRKQPPVIPQQRVLLKFMCTHCGGDTYKGDLDISTEDSRVVLDTTELMCINPDCVGTVRPTLVAFDPS